MTDHRDHGVMRSDPTRRCTSSVHAREYAHVPGEAHVPASGGPDKLISQRNKEHKEHKEHKESPCLPESAGVKGKDVNNHENKQAKNPPRSQCDFCFRVKHLHLFPPPPSGLNTSSASVLGFLFVLVFFPPLIHSSSVNPTVSS